MNGSVLRRSFAAAVVLAVVVMVSAIASPSGAAEQTFEACPSEAEAFVASMGAYPPFVTPSTDDGSTLVDCTSSFTSADTPTNDVESSFEFTGLPTDPCNEVVAVSVTTTGTPGGAGWAIVPFNTADNSPILGPDASIAGAFQQWNAAEDMTLMSNGVTLVSPIAQPAEGAYSVSFDIDPANISLDELAAGQLGASILVINIGDVIDSIQASVTIDDAGCSSTTTTTAPTTTVPPTTAPVAQPVALRPAFTG